MQTVTSRSFNQDPSSVKRAATLSPVLITERGKVSHILLSIDKYYEITNGVENIVDMLSIPDVNHYEFSKFDGKSIKAADLS